MTTSVDNEMIDMIEPEQEEETVSGTEVSAKDPKWTEHVLSFLEPEEFIDGHPGVAGLRRLTELLYGEILSSETTINHSVDAKYEVCVATHRISVRRPNGLIVCASAAVDVTVKNTSFPFNQFLTSTADSRAEAKALRRLLKLNIITAEELGSEELTTLIAPEQIIAIDKLCERNNLDVLKIVKKFGTYKSIDDVPKATAREILKSLSSYQTDKNVFGKSFEGYKKGWRK